MTIQHHGCSKAHALNSMLKPIKHNLISIYINHNLVMVINIIFLDIDECTIMHGNGTFGDRCVHGENCINTVGGWNCTCPRERLLMSIGNDTYRRFRCQGIYMISLLLLVDTKHFKHWRLDICRFWKMCIRHYQ